MRSGDGAHDGLDAASARYVDPMEASVAGPTKLIRTAFGNAIAIAYLPRLTEAALTDVPEPHEGSPLKPRGFER